MREVVRTKNLEQWDYVKNKIGNPLHLNNYDFNRVKKSCINIKSGKCGGLEYYQNNNNYKIISFEEFKSRYELKIGDIFEYNGFVCRVESEVERWVYNTSSKAFYKTKTNHDHEIEITNKEFIKQLEENAR